MKRILNAFIALVLLTQLDIQAQELSLPSFFSSGMVLQRNTVVSVWGTAAPGSEVSLQSAWGAKALVQVDENGKWMARLNTGKAGGPYTLNILSGKEEITLKDILIGEVWLCSGQSNMEMPLAGWLPNDPILNSEEEIRESDNPELRMFTVARNISPEPLDDCQGQWKSSNPENAPSFSATAYFFGKKLYEKLKIPIGLIHASWGGTPAESWTERMYVERLPEYKGFKEEIAKAQIEYDAFMEWMGKLEHELIPDDDPEFYKNLDKKATIYAASDLDDSDWNEMHVPALWEREALPAFDGMIWFRKSFTISKKLEGKEMILELGPVDDIDICFINGVEVGQLLELGYYKKDRVYKIPEGLLKLGENTLAVCVIDYTGAGGIWSSDDILITDDKGSELILTGEWKFMPIAQILGDGIYYFDEDMCFAKRPPQSLVFGAHTPTALYNAMINPLAPYTLKGAIWYQGESNVGRGYQYRSLFPLMIKSWRDAWGLGDFPFYFTQIAPYNYGEKVASAAAEVREAQLMTLALPNTGMAVTMDIGNPDKIHPANKRDVGERLARWALKNDYGYDEIIVSGPLYKSLEIKGSNALVSFDHTYGGLMLKEDELSHFEIAGRDMVYHQASVEIVSEDRIRVSCPEVKNPVAVRYGWSDKAEPNLFNGEGLPASPFRTDNWKRISE